MDKYAELRDKAKKATRGPWAALECKDFVAAENGNGQYVTAAYRPVDRDYIAAASPDVVLALLAERDALREALEDILVSHAKECPSDNGAVCEDHDLFVKGWRVLALASGEGEHE